MENNAHHLVAEHILNGIVEKYIGKPGMLLSTLEEVQEANRFKFLPEQTLSQVAHKLQVPLTQVYSVATFYSFFNLKPQGKHSIIVCRGTACHTKGSRELLDNVGRVLGYKCVLDETEPSFTTPDNEFTIRTVACFGQCPHYASTQNECGIAVGQPSTGMFKLRPKSTL